jgi:hypothetical protein
MHFKKLKIFRKIPKFFLTFALRPIKIHFFRISYKKNDMIVDNNTYFRGVLPCDRCGRQSKLEPNTGLNIFTVVSFRRTDSGTAAVSACRCFHRWVALSVLIHLLCVY